MQSVIGEIYTGKVTGITAFGAFVKMENGESGMVHISEVAPVFVRDIHDHLSEGQEVKVKVLAINESNKISLSIKQAQPRRQEQRSGQERKNAGQEPRSAPRPENAPARAPRQSGGPRTFEEMMAKFKQDSEENMSALKRSGEQTSRPRRK